MGTMTAGIRRIETVGTLVRTGTGQLARITGVYEQSRCSADHVSAPLDVVVALESVGPSYGHDSAWASDLTPGHDGDVGAHPHRPGRCECGRDYGNRNGSNWFPAPASWLA